MFIVRLYPHNTGDPEEYPFTTPEAAQEFCDRVNALPIEDRAFLCGAAVEEEPEASYWQVTPYQSAEAGWEELTGYYAVEEMEVSHD